MKMNKAVVISSLAILLLVSSCERWTSTNKGGISNFPEKMVGTWDCQFSPLDAHRWQFTFEKDGTISKAYHYVFGGLSISDGGALVEGPDPNTYMLYTLKPIETKYNPVSKIINIKVEIDDYEMKFPTGTLRGRIIDKLSGKASEDGLTWKVEWRSYGWLDGATEPPIELIDANPEILSFQKVGPNQ
jgi:hypothetical protein